MRITGVLSHVVLYLFLMVFMWVGVTYVSQNIWYSSARNFYSSVVSRLENSYFDERVIDMCKEDARENGYRLTVDVFGEEGERDARVILDMTYVFPILKTARQYTIEGYAR